MTRMTADEFRKSQGRLFKPAARRKHQSIEHDIQAKCFAWFSLRFPKLSDLFFAIPNGGQRSITTAVTLQREGVKAGVPDTFFAYPSYGYHGLFIEFKKSRIGKRGDLIDKGHLSDNQEYMIGQLTKSGYKVEVCYSFEQFQQIMYDYILNEKFYPTDRAKQVQK